MSWYFIKVAYISYQTRKSEMGSLIINCHPSDIYTKVNEYINGRHIEIINIVKL